MKRQSCCDDRVRLAAEVQRLKTALDFTRDKNRELVEENRRLREGRGLAPPDPLDGPVVVTVHPDLVPPPPPEPPPSKEPGARRKYRDDPYRNVYAGERPLRTQWPIYGEGESA